MGKLRISLDSKYKEASSGPQMFMYRLICELMNKYPVEFTSKNPHISFGSIVRHKVKGAKQILRVDGCYYNRAFGVSMNGLISQSIEKSHAVIYQSKFSQRLCEKILGVKAKKSTVIYNGVNQKWVSSIPAVQFPEKHVFVAVASWRNSKRPKSIINSFLESNLDDSRLVIVGKYNKIINNPKVSFVGRQKADKVIAYIKSAKALIHICKIESCPNTVIESLSAGVPVICNNIGGTPEIVQKDGICVDIDKKFKFRYIKEKNVDNIDCKIVAEAINECCQRDWNIKREDLDISRTALEYYNFFKLVLNS